MTLIGREEINTHYSRLYGRFYLLAQVRPVFVLLLHMGPRLECCRRSCKRLHGAAVADLERMLGNGRNQPFQNFR